MQTNSRTFLSFIQNLNYIEQLSFFFNIHAKLVESFFFNFERNYNLAQHVLTLFNVPAWFFFETSPDRVILVLLGAIGFHELMVANEVTGFK